jgi:hypothetical protein
MVTRAKPIETPAPNLGPRTTRITPFVDRRTGFSIYLCGTPWSDEFVRQYAAGALVSAVK